jgi:glutathione S-transferase
VPQLYNAERFQVPLDDYPQVRRIGAACRALPAFAQAAPEAQADAT